MKQITNWLTSKFRKHAPVSDVKLIHPFGIYAVTTGHFVGEMWVLIDDRDGEYRFLSVPSNVNRTAPIEKVDFGVKEKIIEYVSDLPTDMHALIKDQFNYNEVPANKWVSEDSKSDLELDT